ncbi:hypothetical protein OHB49_00885 [Streptomyces sp. NBC_01717]|uniref:hypothetical protein n=1 Tax=Streptomyces sp. NBC_01717 TaxID=2975918 RepID=UPI002E31CDAD|nr:hypothetical protein [Streptomyces sp. NBC_01717]
MGAMALGPAIAVLSDRKTTGAPPLPGGIHEIWLDCKVKAALADSTAQIGAPHVWDEGAIGTGGTGVQAAELCHARQLSLHKDLDRYDLLVVRQEPQRVRARGLPM